MCLFSGLRTRRSERSGQTFFPHAIVRDLVRSLSRFSLLFRNLRASNTFARRKTHAIIALRYHAESEGTVQKESTNTAWNLIACVNPMSNLWIAKKTLLSMAPSKERGGWSNGLFCSQCRSERRIWNCWNSSHDFCSFSLSSQSSWQSNQNHHEQWSRDRWENDRERKLRRFHGSEEKSTQDPTIDSARLYTSLVDSLHNYRWIDRLLLLRSECS